MNYKDYKRKAKLAEILDKPLEDDYLVIHKFVQHLDTLERNKSGDGYTYYSNDNGPLFLIGHFDLLFFYVYNYDDPIMDIFENHLTIVESFIADILNDKLSSKKVEPWNVYIKEEALKWS
jgi:hypothetical protein